jgi:hypothetical protein
MNRWIHRRSRAIGDVTDMASWIALQDLWSLPIIPDVFPAKDRLHVRHFVQRQ